MSSSHRRAGPEIFIETLLLAILCALLALLDASATVLWRSILFQPTMTEMAR